MYFGKDGLKPYTHVLYLFPSIIPTYHEYLSLTLNTHPELELRIKNMLLIYENSVLIREKDIQIGHFNSILEEVV